METFTPYDQILIYQEHLGMPTMDFYTVFDTDQAQINFFLCKERIYLK